MSTWIFQDNPDKFDLDGYLASTKEIVWTVNQGHFAPRMEVGDRVFLWRAAGRARVQSGVLAEAVMVETPRNRPEDEESRPFWRIPPEGDERLRAGLRILRIANAKEILRREWLKEDPVLREARILRLANETNYLLSPPHAERLATLWRNTGRDWNRAETVAGLWAYFKTSGSEVSKRPGSPVAEVSVLIGRAVQGVYNKVMNFRALDPNDARVGFTGGGALAAEVWREFYDPIAQRLRGEALEAAYENLWLSLDIERSSATYARPSSKELFQAPDDDPAKVQLFVRKVRAAQARFRKNMLDLYGGKCAITGWGPDVVLEGAHVLSHASSFNNHTDNGILLRADLHTLFDTGLLRIEPATLTVRLDERLKGTRYWSYHGSSLRPREDGSQPRLEYLEQRWAEGAAPSIPSVLTE